MPTDPWLVLSFLDALIARLRRVQSLRQQGCRQRAADAGKCPTCRDPIAGLEPLPIGEHRERPWEYCSTCKADDRDRKAAVRLARGMTPRRRAA